MPEREPISVRVVERDGAVVLSPQGEIGYHEAPTLQGFIRAAYDKRPKKLIVDLSGVSYMATPGLATLVEALQIAKKSTVALVLCGLSDRVRAVFDIARLNTVFTIVGSVEQAVGT